jgi:hypothetical protein
MTEHPPMEITVRESGTIPILEVRGRLTIGDPSEQLPRLAPTRSSLISMAFRKSIALASLR